MDMPIETYTPEMCEQMKELVCMADIVPPERDGVLHPHGYPLQKGKLDAAGAFKYGDDASAHGCEVSGHHGSPRRQLLHERGPGTRADGSKIYQDKIFRRRAPGNRRCFLLRCGGCTPKWKVLPEAVAQAAGFVKECIKVSDEEQIPHANGVCFEKILGKLIKSKRNPLPFLEEI